MAGFYPHIGTSFGTYTALARVSASAFLDSLVGDLTGNTGGTINGWSLYDDLRSNGSSYPLWVPVMTNGGGVLNSYNSPGVNSFYFVSGSITATSYLPWGFDFRVNLSTVPGTGTVIGSGTGGATTISIDPTGTNVYQAYVSSVTLNYVTATLDRNYAQATAGCRIFWKKLIRYVVFKQTSGTKTFYVLVAQTHETVGGPQMYIQVYEGWNATTHQGTVGSAIEHTPFWVEMGINPRASMRYVVWFIPEVFAIWTSGDPVWGSPNEKFSYVGNMDTSGLRSGDADALVFIPADTTLTGFHNNTIATNQTARTAMAGASQCLRTLQGEPWSMPDGISSGYYFRNQYYPFPRGKWYAFGGGNGTVDSAARFQYTDLDLYHGDHAFYGESSMGQNEGRRGALRYVKIPTSNPSGMHLGTIGPAADGATYMFIRQNNTIISRINQNVAVAYDNNQWGSTNPLATGWSWSVIYGGYQGEVSSSAGGIGSYNWLMMPIS